MNAVLPFRVWITHRLPFYLGGAYLSAPTPKGADELVLALCANTEKDTYRKPQGFVVLFLFINNFSFSNERKISLESFLKLKTFFVLVTFYFFTFDIHEMCIIFFENYARKIWKFENFVVSLQSLFRTKSKEPRTKT